MRNIIYILLALFRLTTRPPRRTRKAPWYDKYVD